MNATFAFAAGTPPARRIEASIISHREIEPLLARARQTVIFYAEATDCSAAVLDKSGHIIETPKTKDEPGLCEFCKKYYHEIWEGREHPCVKTHLNALAESRRAAAPYVYLCPVGLVYWTSPLFRKGNPAVTVLGGRYRNGRYAGALTAGRVLFRGDKTAGEKFLALCKDKIAAAKFLSMLEKVPEKTHEEIHAMARLLGVCAEETSTEEENAGTTLRRMAWQEGGATPAKPPSKIPAKEKQPSPEEGDSEYPMEKERMLLAAFRRGDKEIGENILKDLVNSILAAAPGNFEIIRFRVIELVVLLSRAAAGASGGDAPQETNNRYLRRIQESKTTEELIENLYTIAERVAGKIFSFQGIRHASALRRAERYIWKNYTRKISLDDIAKASGLSAPYFSSVFKEEMGENLSSYLNRLRVERATALLTETDKGLPEIARLCGFEDQSWFSKIFKRFAGMSPGKYRES